MCSHIYPLYTMYKNAQWEGFLKEESATCCPVVSCMELLHSAPAPPPHIWPQVASPPRAPQASPGPPGACGAMSRQSAHMSALGNQPSHSLNDFAFGCFYLPRYDSLSNSREFYKQSRLSRLDAFIARSGNTLD